jgi:hypothetical protein
MATFHIFRLKFIRMDALIDFGKILIPASLVLYAAYLLVRSFLAKEIELKETGNPQPQHRNRATTQAPGLRKNVPLPGTNQPAKFVGKAESGLDVPSREFHQVLLNEIQK